MPELPEVETIVRQIRHKLVGKICTNLKIVDSKLIKPPFSIKDSLIKDVDRFGKEILISFLSSKKKNIYLRIHLRMTGRLLTNINSSNANFHTDESFLQQKIIRIGGNNLSKHVRAIFNFSDINLYFFDTRRFGTFKWDTLVPSLNYPTIDPVKNTLTLSLFTELLKRSQKSTLKNFLMNQKYLIGIGNIYASEILYKAGLHPLKLVSSLSLEEIKKLKTESKSVLNLAIKHNGTTFSDFQLDDASTGHYQAYLKVYGKEGKPCQKCSSIINKIKINQRSTFFCPCCQE